MDDNNILNRLVTALENFENSISKDVDEVRKQRAAVQDIKDELTDYAGRGRIIRDDKRIILSAPEIIIGNVDNEGELIADSSSAVVVRGNTVSVEGVGESGSITQRAPSVSTIAVDPGTDGLQSIVYTTSNVVTQARNITIQSSDDEDCFAQLAGAGSGVNILSDTNINVSATPSCSIKKAAVEERLTNLKTELEELTATATTQKDTVTSLVDSINELLDNEGTYNDDENDIRTNYSDIDDMQDTFSEMEQAICSAVSHYVRTLARKAEVNRIIKALTATKDALSEKESTFATDSTGAGVSIQSETVMMSSVDGDGNIRENAEAGLFMNMPHIVVEANDADGKLIADSSVSVNSQDISLSTVSTELSDDETTGDFNATGSFTITSKEVTVQAIDSQLADDKISLKDITAGGKFTVNAETMALVATDKDGKSTGSFDLNAKSVKVATMDTDAETKADTAVADGSEFILNSSKVRIGTTEKTTLIQTAAQSIALIAKDTAEMQQDGKAVVTLSGGNMTAGGSAVELDGDTTISGGAEIKGETKTPKVTADEVKASSAFKSPTITDTQGAGSPASATSPSAKLTEEVIV